MSTEVSNLLSQVRNSRIKMVITNAITGGWRIDHHKQGPAGAVYLFWPPARKSVLVPYSGRWDEFKPAAKRMEAISNMVLLPPLQSVGKSSTNTKFATTQVEFQPPTMETPAKDNLAERLDALRKEHHDLTWEYRILAWGEHNPDEIKQAREILIRLHMIELTLLDMGQPLSERKATPTS